MTLLTFPRQRVLVTNEIPVGAAFFPMLVLEASDRRRAWSLTVGRGTHLEWSSSRSDRRGKGQLAGSGGQGLVVNDPARPYEDRGANVWKGEVWIMRALFGVGGLFDDYFWTIREEWLEGGY